MRTPTKRRKVRLTLTPEMGDEDTDLLRPEEGPYLSGDGDTDLLCGRCDQTLVRGIGREDVCGVYMRLINAMRVAQGLGIYNSGTAVENRPFPLVAHCDCGAINRVWPIIPS
jgi:hypothetical protein